MRTLFQKISFFDKFFSFFDIHKVVLVIYNNLTPKEIKEKNVSEIFTTLGLKEHLSPSRRNGLESMIEKIKYYADIL